MTFFREMKSVLGSRYLNSVILLTQISLSKQYRYSFLGMAWTLLLPTVQIVVYAFIFSALLKVPQKSQTLYIMTGILPWTFISTSIMSSCQSLLNNAGSIKRCIISKTIFPVSDVLRNLYLFFISFGCLYFLSMFMFADPHWTFIQFPIAILPMVIFTFAASVAVSFVTPYLRDINEFLNVFFMIGFYITPILYHIDMIPENLRPYFKLNPMYVLLKPIYTVVYDQKVLGLNELISAFMVAGLVFVFSYIIYRKTRDRVIFYF